MRNFIKIESMGKRREARLRVLQSLYAYEVSGNSIEQIIDDPILEDPICKKPMTPSIEKFYEQLVKKTIKNMNDFDNLIKSKSANWEFDRITIIDKIILRQSICEFLCFPDIPPKVTIDEAIEISKVFSTEKSSKFINGILDSILLDLSREGRIFKKGRGLNEGTSKNKK
jgi:N utilization substance protein B